MAKRKLSADQRRELRAWLTKAVDGGRPTPEIIKDAASKYGISPITARWYLKSLNGSGARARRRPTKSSRNGVSARSNGALEVIVQDALVKAREAKRLLPRWQKLVAREVELRRLVKKVGVQLTRTSRKAKTLGGRIAELTR
jgi:transposase